MMEEIRCLLNELLKNKTDRALKETIDLLIIANGIYAGDFMEMCSISYPEVYDENTRELEDIRQEMLMVSSKLVKSKNQVMIY